MAAIGWHSGDLETARAVLWHVLRAFEGERGSIDLYYDSHAFLRSLYLVVKHVEDHQRSSNLPEKAEVQIATINRAYVLFQIYVMEHTGVTHIDKKWLRGVLPKVRWSMTELYDNVQRLKMQSLDAVIEMEILFVIDLSKRVNSLMSTSQLQRQLMTTAAAVLRSLRLQLSNLLEVSKEYQELLNYVVQTKNGHSTNVQSVRIRLDDVTRLCSRLETDFQDLMTYLQDKARNDQARRQEWQMLLEDCPELDEYDDDMRRRHDKAYAARASPGKSRSLSESDRSRYAAMRSQGMNHLSSISERLREWLVPSNADGIEDARTSASTSRGPTSRRDSQDRHCQNPHDRSIPLSPRRTSIHIPLPIDRMSRRRPQPTSQPLSPPSRSDQYSVSNEPDRPALPPRYVSEPSVPTDDSLALVPTESPPELPPRTYSLPNNSTSAARPVIRRPQQLMGPSFVLQEESGDPKLRITEAASAESGFTIEALLASDGSSNAASSIFSRPSPMAEFRKIFEKKPPSDTKEEFYMYAKV